MYPQQQVLSKSVARGEAVTTSMEVPVVLLVPTVLREVVAEEAPHLL
jgi:hypothetical protein